MPLSALLNASEWVLLRKVLEKERTGTDRTVLGSGIVRIVLAWDCLSRSLIAAASGEEGAVDAVAAGAVERSGISIASVSGGEEEVNGAEVAVWDDCGDGGDGGEGPDDAHDVDGADGADGSDGADGAYGAGLLKEYREAKRLRFAVLKDGEEQPHGLARSVAKRTWKIAADEAAAASKAVMDEWVFHGVCRRCRGFQIEPRSCRGPDGNFSSRHRHAEEARHQEVAAREPCHSACAHCAAARTPCPADWGAAATGRAARGHRRRVGVSGEPCRATSVQGKTPALICAGEAG
jgi:hypothetical protein